MIHGATDLGAEAAFAWSWYNLYLAVRITDELHAQPFSDWLLWNGDCVQVGVDPFLDSGEDGYGPDDTEFGFTFHEDGGTENWFWVSPGKTGYREGMEIAAERTDSETIYEVRVPATLLEPWWPRVLSRIGINVAVADADAAALEDLGAGALGRKGRESALEITDSLIYRKRPDLFAILELEPAPAGGEEPIRAFLARGRAANETGKPVDLLLYSWAKEPTPATATLSLRAPYGLLSVAPTLSIPAGFACQRILLDSSGIQPGLLTLEADVEYRSAPIAARTMDVFFW